MQTLVRLKRGDALSVPIAFSNTSDEVFRYCIDSEGGLCGLTRTLEKDGWILRTEVDRESPAVGKGSERELPPGQVFRYSVSLEDYGKLKPGVYRVRLSYSVTPRSHIAEKFKATVIEREQDILLEIE